MKTTLAAASFALIAALSGASTTHATGFNDQSAIPAAALAQTERQDLSHLPTIHGFNQLSHHTAAALGATTDASRTAVAGANCDLSPRVGFNGSTSFASC